MKTTIEKLEPEEMDAPGVPEFAEQPSTRSAIGGLLDAEDAIDADDLDDISNGGEQRFEPVCVTLKNQKKVRVFVAELDILDIMDVEAGRLLVRGQQVLRAPAFEGKMGLALEFVAAVYKRTRAGEFVPMFNDTKAAQAWMKRPNNKPLVSQIVTAIYIVNPEMSPKKKLEAAKQIS